MVGETGVETETRQKVKSEELRQTGVNQGQNISQSRQCQGVMLKHDEAKESNLCHTDTNVRPSETVENPYQSRCLNVSDSTISPETKNGDSGLIAAIAAIDRLPLRDDEKADIIRRLCAAK